MDSIGLSFVYFISILLGQAQSDSLYEIRYRKLHYMGLYVCIDIEPHVIFCIGSRDGFTLRLALRFLQSWWLNLNCERFSRLNVV